MDNSNILEHHSINKLPPKHASAQKPQQGIQSYSGQLKKMQHLKENTREFQAGNSCSPSGRKQNSIALISKYQQAPSILSKGFTDKQIPHIGINRKTEELTEQRKNQQKLLEQKAIGIIEEQNKRQQEQEAFIAGLQNQLIELTQQNSMKDLEKKTLEDKCIDIIQEKSNTIFSLEKALFDQKINSQNLEMQVKQINKTMINIENDKEKEVQLRINCEIKMQDQDQNALKMKKLLEEKICKLAEEKDDQIQEIKKNLGKVIEKQRVEIKKAKDKFANLIITFSERFENFTKINTKIKQNMKQQGDQLVFFKNCLSESINDLQNKEKLKDRTCNLQIQKEYCYIYQSNSISDSEFNSLQNQVQQLQNIIQYYEQNQQNQIEMREHQRVIEEKLKEEKMNNQNLLEMERIKQGNISLQLEKSIKVNFTYEEENQMLLKQQSEIEDQLIKIRQEVYQKDNEIVELKHRRLILEKENISLSQQKDIFFQELTSENKEKKEIAESCENYKQKYQNLQEEVKEINDINQSLEKSLSLLNKEKISLIKYGKDLQKQMDEQIVSSIKEIQKVKNQNFEMQKVYEQQDFHSLLKKQLENQVEESNQMLNDLQRELNKSFELNAQLLQENQKLKYEINNLENNNSVETAIAEEIEQNKQYKAKLETKLKAVSEQNLKLENNLKSIQEELDSEKKNALKFQENSDQIKADILKFFKQQISLLHGEQNKLSFIISKQLKSFNFELSHKNNRILQSLRDLEINNEEQKIQIKVDLNAKYELQQDQAMSHQKLHLEEIAQQQQFSLLSNIAELNQKIALQQKKFILIDNENHNLNHENEIIWSQLKRAEKENEVLREQINTGKMKKYQVKLGNNGSRKNSSSGLSEISQNSNNY